jgi:hypothetical protein
VRTGHGGSRIVSRLRRLPGRPPDLRPGERHPCGFSSPHCCRSETVTTPTIPRGHRPRVPDRVVFDNSCRSWCSAAPTPRWLEEPATSPHPGVDCCPGSATLPRRPRLRGR